MKLTKSCLTITEKALETRLALAVPLYDRDEQMPIPFDLEAESLQKADFK